MPCRCASSARACAPSPSAPATRTSLALPYLPGNADIKNGDLLVTSGLGGVFPAGYPVARVTEVHRDAVQPLAQVRAAPLAHVDTDSEVMLVWFRADHPAAPVTPRPGAKPDAVGELKRRQCRHAAAGRGPCRAASTPRPPPDARAAPPSPRRPPRPAPARAGHRPRERRLARPACC